MQTSSSARRVSRRPRLSPISAQPRPMTARPIPMAKPCPILCGPSVGFSEPARCGGLSKTEDDVVAVLDWCNEVGAAAIPFGGGSSVTSGVEPPPGDAYPGSVSIDLRCLDKVLEIDETSRAARIQAGVYGPALEAQLKPHGYTLRHYPSRSSSRLWAAGSPPVQADILPRCTPILTTWSNPPESSPRAALSPRAVCLGRALAQARTVCLLARRAFWASLPKPGYVCSIGQCIGPQPRCILKNLRMG